MKLPPDQRRNSIISGLAVLLLRGVLLWVVVPISALIWPVVATHLRRRHVTFGQYLGWVDLNLIACLQRTILRPLVRAPSGWVPVSEMPHVMHRLRGIDPA